jgi:hypothetical protein
MTPEEKKGNGSGQRAEFGYRVVGIATRYPLPKFMAPNAFQGFGDRIDI